MTAEKPPTPGAVRFESVVPILRVRSLPTSLEHYEKVLGFQVDWNDEGILASVSRDGCALMLCEGDQGLPGTWIWIGVGDAGALHDEYAAAGAAIRLPPTNYPWAYEFHVEDPDGHVLRFGSDAKPELPFAAWVFWYRDRIPRGSAHLLALVSALCVLSACARPDAPAPQAATPASQVSPEPTAATAATASAGIDPLAGALRHCSGHVTGAPRADGAASAHIGWETYASREPLSSLRRSYTASFGSEPTLAREECVAWQAPRERPERVVELCPPTASGPWSTCPPPPEGTATLVLVSIMARPAEPDTQAPAPP